jgi:hypothetical protein
MADWKEILSDNGQQVSDEELLKYLDDNTPEEEKAVIEDKITNNSFESDAIDGLQQINNPERVKKHVSQLNQKLHQQLHSKKHRLEKGKIKDFQWVILTLLILLFICFISYFIMHLNNKGSIIEKPGQETKTN